MMKNQSSPVTYRWTMLFVATLIIFVHSFVFQSVPPVMGELIQDLDLSYKQLGGLMGAYSLPGALLSIMAGVLAERFGSLKIGTAGLLSLLIGTVLVAMSACYGLLTFGRVVGGAGAAVLFVVAPVAVNSWFARQEIGLAMGIYNIAIPGGTILAFNLLGPIAGEHGWQSAMWICVLMAATALVAYRALYRDPEKSQQTNEISKRLSFTQFVRQADLSIWLLSLVFILYSASMLQVFTIGPSYFSETYDGRINPDLIASLPTIVSLLLMPLAGKLIDLTGKKEWMVIIGSVGSAAVLWLIPVSGIHPVASMLLLGIFMAVLLPALYAFPADILHPGEDNIAFGVISGCFGVGIIFGSFIAGALRDISGNFNGSFFSMALMCLMMVIPVIWIMRRLNRKRA
jgi:MFS family permease